MSDKKVIDFKKAKVDEQYKQRDKLLESGSYMKTLIIMPSIEDIDKADEMETPFIQTEMKDCTLATVYASIKAMESTIQHLMEKYPELQKMREYFEENYTMEKKEEVELDLGGVKNE